MWGGSGDDKIWLVEPDRRADEVGLQEMDVGYGGVGNDKLYGTDAADTLWGDGKDDAIAT